MDQKFVDLKLKAVNTQLNPHFVFNTLNAIQFFITTEDKKSALEYLSTFSKLLRFYLNQIEKDTVDLKDEINLLKNYIKLQKLRYQNQFDCVVKIEGNLKNTVASIPSLTLHTLIENMIEHAVYEQHKNHCIYMNITVERSRIFVQIKFQFDNLDQTTSYLPEYRASLLKWQDQLKMLNANKKYNIRKKVTFSKNKFQNKGRIFLCLPNLG